MKRRVPDVTKAKQVLGFEAKVPLRSKLPEVVEYVKTRVLPRLAEAKKRG